MTTDDRAAAVPASVSADPPEVEPEAEGDAPHQRGRLASLPVWQETLILLGVAVVLAVVIKAFFIQAFYIPSESMEPGLVENDRILVEKWSYWLGGSPDRGDVIVFEDPGGWLVSDDTGPGNPVADALAKVGLFPSGGHLVKRVIGIEGDVITCCDDQGRISVNNQPIDEDYVLVGAEACGNGPMTGRCNWTAGPVPEDHVFVMGDHRDASADSTVHMCVEGETECVPGREYVDEDLIVGKVFAVVWPLSHGDWVGTPDSFDAVPDPQ